MDQSYSVQPELRRGMWHAEVEGLSVQAIDQASCSFLMTEGLKLAVDAMEYGLRGACGTLQLAHVGRHR